MSPGPTTGDASSARIAAVPTSAASEWTAFHLFLSNQERAEDYLIEQVAPLVKAAVSAGQADRWFFIRYWEGGPHLRLRLRRLQDAPSLEAALQTAITDYVVADPIRPEVYYDGHGFDGEAVDLNTIPWYGEGAVVPLAYEPETGRYGGPAAISLNEELFGVSSELAVALIRSTPLAPEEAGGYTKRISVALILMLATIFSLRLPADASAEFFANYARFWEGYAGVDSLGDALGGAMGDDSRFADRIARVATDVASGQGSAMQKLWVTQLDRTIHGYRELHRTERLLSPLTGEVTRTEADFDSAALSLLGSQMHMLNNRLAISPPLEHHLAKRISDAMLRGSSA